MEESKTKSLDKKFIISAGIIGILYAGITALIAETVSKEAAGAAGVALTAISTAMFREFEKLRFKDSPSQDGILINFNLESPILYLFLSMVFFGFQAFIGFLVSLVLALLMKLEFIEDPLFLLGSFGFLITSVALNCIAVRFAASISTKLLLGLRTSTLVITCFVVTLFQIILPISQLLILDYNAAIEYLPESQLMSQWGITSLGYCVLTVTGAKAGRKGIKLKNKDQNPEVINFAQPE